MLKRDSLVKQISVLAEKLFPRQKHYANIVLKAWLELSANEAFLNQAKRLKNQAVIPSWDGQLCETVKIESNLNEYELLAVDGSQIYPDHHMADVGCFLINCGGCKLSYGKTSQAELFTEPYVFLSDQLLPKKIPVQFSTDLVDLKREELEFFTMLQKAQAVKEAFQEHKDFCCLFDGSLIFWHLETKQKEIKDFFLSRYLELLDGFYQQRIPIAGYLSLPRSRELIRLVKVWLCQYLAADGTPCKIRNPKCPCSAVGDMVDWQLVVKYVEPGYRTNIFYSHSKIIDSYPEHLKPCFFYLNVGQEIVRIEMPRWVVDDKEAFNLVASMCLDQSRKGYGYPVALAESHEQAVVTNADREFFYHLIRKMGMDYKKWIYYSQKLAKKRGMKF